MNVNDSDIVRSILLNHGRDGGKLEETTNVGGGMTTTGVTLRSVDSKYPIDDVRSGAVDPTSKQRRHKSKRNDGRRKRIMGFVGGMEKRLAG
mmetsp:Transcript_24194/g.44778  ORF Transcript_24194/g.44778 Transcript_24194/m.44778 type:complete len:92 (+) Transcript_24194:2-277(+)